MHSAGQHVGFSLVEDAGELGSFRRSWSAALRHWLRAPRHRLGRTRSRWRPSDATAALAGMSRGFAHRWNGKAASRMRPLRLGRRSEEGRHLSLLVAAVVDLALVCNALFVICKLIAARPFGTPGRGISRLARGKLFGGERPACPGQFRGDRRRGHRKYHAGDVKKSGCNG